MGARIDCYLDTVSIYSYLAFVSLLRLTPLLKQHGVEVEFHPVFLGAINNKTGNLPPITLPARAKIFPYELGRAAKFFDVKLKKPPKFPFLSLLPQRCLTYIKTKYPNETFVAALEAVIKGTWGEGTDPSEQPTLFRMLSTVLPDEEVKTIIEAAAEGAVKEALVKTTDVAVESGAYGAPWMLVTNSSGVTEPFFGSDRFHYMWEFLGLPHRNIELLPPGKANL